jgi:hypothetical protein
MTKKLEKLFELDQEEQTLDTEILEPDISTELISQDTLATIEKVEQALPQVKGLESSDNEMDELATLAKSAFDNLMDLGMQVDSRFSAEIFNSASSMLGHALTAKTAKINKKLKMIDLQLKKAELDRKLSLNNKQQPPEETPLGTGQVLDRNELIKMIMSNADSKNDKKDK